MEPRAIAIVVLCLLSAIFLLSVYIRKTGTFKRARWHFSENYMPVRRILFRKTIPQNQISLFMALGRQNAIVKYNNCLYLVKMSSRRKPGLYFRHYDTYWQAVCRMIHYPKKLVVSQIKKEFQQQLILNAGDKLPKDKEQ